MTVRLGLPRARRVRSRRDFVKIQQGGQRVSTTHFVLIVAPGADLAAPARLGITASKQVGNAAIRARCKRLVREAFRLDPGLLPAGVDLVVIARTGAHQLGLAGVQGEWASVRAVIQRRAAAVLRAK